MTIRKALAAMEATTKEVVFQTAQKRGLGFVETIVWLFESGRMGREHFDTLPWTFLSEGHPFLKEKILRTLEEQEFAEDAIRHEEDRKMAEIAAKIPQRSMSTVTLFQTRRAAQGR